MKNYGNDPYDPYKCPNCGRMIDFLEGPCCDGCGYNYVKEEMDYDYRKEILQKQDQLQREREESKPIRLRWKELCGRIRGR
jgi:predicted amidophosphoribosyltransferase